MAIDQDIAELSLEAIAFKIHVDEGWPIEEIDAVELQYRAFLHGIRHLRGGLVPTKQIDTFWHHHILDTQKYAEDCERLFGRFVHHYPYAGLFGKEDAERHAAKFAESQIQIAKIIANEKE